MKHGSLFSGIGGFDIAAQWMGWENTFQCEIDPFCQKVLQYHFPECELFTDIKTTDFTKYANAVDVISGGFPCQPFSVAGKRKGTDDDRFLWDEMFRVIQEVSPRWVVAENVFGLLTQERGVVFEQVCTDMEGVGYEVQSFVIPACAVGAPHRRERVFIIANAKSKRIENRRSDCCRKHEKTEKRENSRIEFDRFIKEWTTSHAIGERLSRKKPIRQSKRPEQSIPHWGQFPTQPPICSRNDGISAKLDSITFPRWRIESIKAYGNAIVPQVAYQIFKAIEETNKIYHPYSH